MIGSCHAFRTNEQNAINQQWLSPEDCCSSPEIWSNAYISCKANTRIIWKADSLVSLSFANRFKLSSSKQLVQEIKIAVNTKLASFTRSVFQQSAQVRHMLQLWRRLAQCTEKLWGTKYVVVCFNKNVSISTMPSLKANLIGCVSKERRDVREDETWTGYKTVNNACIKTVHWEKIKRFTCIHQMFCRNKIRPWCLLQ